MLASNKNLKIGIYALISVLFISGLFVVADYYSLFGTKTTLKLDFLEVRIRTIDAETGALVFDVGVRCFQKNTMDACTRRESHKAGIVAAHIPVRRVIVSSLLFKKSEEIIKAADPKMHIMLMHRNYYNPTKTILLEDVYSNKLVDYTVEMPPRKWEEQEEAEE